MHRYTCIYVIHSQYTKDIHTYMDHVHIYTQGTHMLENIDLYKSLYIHMMES